MAVLPQERTRPTLFLLHYLGGSAREWDWVVPLLGPHARCVAIDLPGFGAASHLPGGTLAEMVDAVAAIVRDETPQHWMLAGHSMGAKIALALARRAEDGADGLGGLSHLTTLAGSPPAPEPMDEDQRAKLLSWFRGDTAASRAEAQSFIDENVGAPLPPAQNQRVCDDLLRTNGSAWRAWLQSGNREDWSENIGVLMTPALIVAGTADGDLGPDAQRRLMAPHFARGRLETLDGAGHLLPMERADDVAKLIIAHCDLVG